MMAGKCLFQEAAASVVPPEKAPDDKRVSSTEELGCNAWYAPLTIAIVLALRSIAAITTP
ncbi:MULTISPECIES: hypothetical protein [unclassified Bradyrhizobium]